jgi:hypothetical protein
MLVISTEQHHMTCATFRHIFGSSSSHCGGGRGGGGGSGGGGQQTTGVAIYFATIDSTRLSVRAAHAISPVMPRVKAAAEPGSGSMAHKHVNCNACAPCRHDAAVVRL